MSSAKEGRAGLWGNLLVGGVLIAAVWGLYRWQLQPWSSPEPDGERVAWTVALLVSYFGAVMFGVWRRRADRPVAQGAAAADTTWVVFASQTGQAEQLAAQTAAALRAGGVPVRELAIADVDAATLSSARQVLFLASTTGEGDPPDTASGFVRRVMASATRFPDLRYGVLALGDRDYDNYCAFGRQLDQWLRHQGASPLFDRVEVDNGDAGALRHWQHHLRQLAGGGELPDWETPVYAEWILERRTLLNPGSAGEPCFHLELRPPAGETPVWQAGDIAEIGPRQPSDEIARALAESGFSAGARVQVDGVAMSLSERLTGCLLSGSMTALDPQALSDRLQALPHREYSIASLPADGAVHLLVRRMPRPDGRAGLGSGWLTEHAPVGARIALRLRRNSSFHPPADDRPLLLIGNGTGLAGLRALLKARIAAGHRRNWLLFGERNPVHDNFHGAEIDTWATQGWIEMLDRVWSRDGARREYVQDRLREQAPRLREWVTQGAAIYVCGSLQGMAPGVDAALTEALGSDTVEHLAETSRYRRDVY